MDVKNLEPPLYDVAMVFADVPMGFCLIGLDLRYLYINAALAAMNGIAPAAHIGRTLREIVPEIAAKDELLLREVISSGESLVTGTQEGLLHSKTGETSYYQSTCTAVRDQSGNVIAVSCLVTNVTKQQRAEDKLQAHLESLEDTIAARTADLSELNERLRNEVEERGRVEITAQETQHQLHSALESISQGFALFDAEDRVLTCNQRIHEMFPELADLFVPGTPFSELAKAAIAHRQLDLSEGQLTELISTQIGLHHRLDIPWEAETLDGRRLRIVGTRTEDGGIAEITTDVTEARLEDVALRESEQRFQDFTSLSADWYAETDAADNFIWG